MAGEEPSETQGLRQGFEAADEGQTSEIRRFLLRHAQKHKIKVKEFFSQVPARIWYAHLESSDNISTAVSYESADSALYKAFLALENSEYDFL